MQRAKLVDHLRSGDAHYQDIQKTILDFVERFNLQNTQQLDQVFVDEVKNVAKHFPGMTVDDLPKIFDLGIVGAFGEFRRVNSQVIFSWFRGYQDFRRREFQKNNPMGNMNQGSAPSDISEGRMKLNRNALTNYLKTFVEQYKTSGAISPKIEHFTPVFYRWFMSLGYLNLTDDQDRKLRFIEKKTFGQQLRDRLGGGEKKKSMNDHVVETIKLAVDNGYPIFDDLEKLPLQGYFNEKN